MNRWEWALCIILTGMMVFAFHGLVYGETKYNPFTGKWEITSTDGELKYNSFQNTWSYQQPGSRLEYNAPQDTWDYAPPERRRANVKRRGSQKGK
jgi:hypothetical protein